MELERLERVDERRITPDVKDRPQRPQDWPGGVRILTGEQYERIFFRHRVLLILLIPDLEKIRRLISIKVATGASRLAACAGKIDP